MTTTNYPNGVTNSTLTGTMNSYTAPDPSNSATYFNDFFTYAAGDWTVTETQAGATQAIGAGDGGWLALVNSAANNDLNAIQVPVTCMTFEAGKQLWFKTRFKVSNATNSAIVIGLQVVDTTPLSVSDGVYFNKAAASTTLNLLTIKTAVGTTTTAIATLADDTFVTVGYYYDGGTTITAYANDASVASFTNTNMPAVSLTVSIGVANGTAAANTLTVDYILASKSRVTAA